MQALLQEQTNWSNELKHGLYAPLLTFATLFFLCNPIHSQTNYSGPQNGSWEDAANWTNGLPASGNDAIIGGGSNTPNIDAPLTIDFAITSFDSIIVTAPVTNQNTISNSGYLQFSAAGSIINEGSFQNFGTTNVLASATFTNESAGSVNNSLGTMTIETTLINKGDVINQGTLTAVSGMIQTQGTFDNRQTMNAEMLEIVTGSTFLNNFGATLNITGTSPTLDINGTLTNNGNITNDGVTNLRGELTNNVSFVNDSGATFTAFTGSILMNNGTFLNKSTFVSDATITNTANFFNEGSATSNGVFNQNNRLENRVGGTFTHNGGGAGTMGMGFGSVLQNDGDFTAKKPIETFGAIINDGTFSNEDQITINSGGTLTNNQDFTNTTTGRIDAQFSVNNDGDFTNDGFISLNSGSILTNTGTFTNAPTGTVANLFEIDNKPNATFINNGRLDNKVRIFTEGAITTNGYYLNQGDMFIRSGGTFNNNGLTEQIAGNIRNEGSLTNATSLLNDDCSTIHNTATINTSGNLRNRGIIIQRGSLNGSVSDDGGFIHTGATSNAPAVCQNKSFSADGDGIVKVYATELIAFENFDSCQNIIYLANGEARPTFECSDIGSVLNVNVKITTRLGDSLTCSSQVTPTDELAPIFADCPLDRTILTTGDDAVSTWTPPTATDNCTTVSLTSDANPGASFPVGINGVTYTASDSYGNEQFCQFRVIVVKLPDSAGGSCNGDNSGPAMTCPSNVSLTTTGNQAAALWPDPIAMDDCLPILLESNKRSGEFFPIGSTTVTYTAADGNDNTSTCSFNVVVTQNDLCAVDNINPSLVNCPSSIVISNIPSLGGAFVGWASPNASDNCALASLSASQNPNTFFPSGNTVVTYTATDGSGNIATCNFTVTVGNNPCPSDNTGPTTNNCPADVTVNTSDDFATASWSPPNFSDPCGPVTVNASHASGATFQVGNTEVVYLAFDAVGNSTECAFNVAIVNPCQPDVTEPVISNCPNDINVQSSNGTTATATWIPPTATDACGQVVLLGSYTSGATFPVGQTQVAYTAIDARGNFAACLFNVNVIGQTTCTTNASPIDGAVEIDPTSVVLTWNDAPDAINYDVYLGTQNPPTTLVTQNVVGTTTTVTNLQQGQTYHWYVVPKNAGGGATGCSIFATSFTTSATGVLTINCPQDITETTAQGATTAIVSYTDATATSTCPIGTVSVGRTNGLASGAAFPVGDSFVEYEATDGCGNMETCSFRITVNQAGAAVLNIQCPQNQLITAAQGASSVIASYTTPTATSTCLTGTVGVNRTGGLASGAAFPIGINTVTYEALDDCGNVKTCSFEIEVVPQGAAVLTVNCPNNIIETAAQGATSTVVNYSLPTATSTCLTGTVDMNRQSGLASGAAFPVGTNTVVYQATDDCGNVEICSFTVTVNSNGGSGDCSDLTYSGAGGKITVGGLNAAHQQVQVFNAVYAPIFDCFDNACDKPTLMTGNLQAGSYIVKVDLYDANWQLICSDEEIVQVTTGGGAVLTLNCPQNQSVTTTGGSNFATANYTTPTVNSTCTTGNVTLQRTSGLASGASFPIGTNTVVYEASDNCGNVETCSFTISVTQGGGGEPTDCSGVSFDGSGGEITITGLTSTHQQVQVFDANYNGIFNCFDNDCDKPSLTVPNLSVGTYNVKVDLYNAAWGFICSKNETVNVTTGNAAVLTINCPSNITRTAASGATFVNVNYSTPTATSTCSGGATTPVRQSGLASGSAFPIGVSTVVYRSTDNCGNDNTCSFTITVNASQSSVLTINCPQNQIVTTTSGVSTAIVNYNAPQGTSTCTSGTVSTVRQSGLASGSAFPVGVNTVVYRATDGCGNVETCSFTITVNQGGGSEPTDCSAVNFDGSGGQIVVSGLTSTHQQVQLFDAAYNSMFNCFDSDCNKPSLTVPNLAVGSYNVKVDLYTASWGFICSKNEVVTVTSGNSAVLTINCPSNITRTAAPGASTRVVNYSTPTATSTCSGGATTPVRQSGLASGSAFPIGTSTVTYASTDNCGNNQTCSFTITVNQAQTGAITLNCPADITVTTNPGSTTVGVTYSAPIAATTCPSGGVSLSRIAGLQSGSAFPIGINTVTYQAIDPCGNLETCTFTVTVNGGTGGGGDCNSIVYSGAGGQIILGGLSAPRVGVQVFDANYNPVFNCFDSNCATPTLTIPNLSNGVYITKVDFYNANYGVICTRQENVTVTTGSGNGSIVQINCPADITLTAPQNTNSAQVTYSTPTGTTNCAQGGVSISRIAGLQSGSSFPVGTTTVIYRATDPCGTSQTCSFDVTVNANSGGGNCGLNISFTQDFSCNQAQGLLTAMVTGASGLQYAWSSGQIGQAIYTTPGTYTVTVTTGNGCTQSATGTLASPVNLDAGINISSQNVSLNPSGGTAPYIAQWAGPNYSIWGPLSVNNLAPGVYTLTLYDATWCSKNFNFTISSNKIATSADIQLNAVVLQGEVSLQGLVQTAKHAEEIFIERRVIDVQNNLEKIAYFIDNQFDIDISGKSIRYFSHKDDAPITGKSQYRIGVLEFDGTILNSDWVDVQINAFERILLYPNPAINQVSLAFEHLPKSDVEVHLVDAFGRVVFEQSFNTQRVIDFDLSHMESGVYYVRVLCEGERKIVRKLVVAR